MDEVRSALKRLKSQVAVIETRITGNEFEAPDSVAGVAAALPESAAALRDAVYDVLADSDLDAGDDLES